MFPALILLSFSEMEVWGIAGLVGEKLVVGEQGRWREDGVWLATLRGLGDDVWRGEGP